MYCATFTDLTAVKPPVCPCGHLEEQQWQKTKQRLIIHDLIWKWPFPAEELDFVALWCPFLVCELKWS